MEAVLSGATRGFRGSWTPVGERSNQVRWLLASDLVDEFTLLIVPVILGQGRRLFPEAGLDVALDLISSRSDAKGVTVQVYRPAGRPEYHPARP